MRIFAVFLVMLAVSSAQADIIQNIIGQVSSLLQRHEEAPYNVTRWEPGYQERQYAAQKWVCTSARSSDANVKESLFWKLFDYISGQNSESTAIDMTVPVTTEFTIHGPTDKEFTMCFYIGGQHQSNTLQPTQSGVFIQNRPALKILTRTVGGYIESEEQWMEEAGKLAAIIQGNGETVSLNHQYWVTYDPPLRFWNRRNEVWFPVA